MISPHCPVHLYNTVLSQSEYELFSLHSILLTTPSKEQKQLNSPLHTTTSIYWLSSIKRPFLYKKYVISVKIITTQGLSEAKMDVRRQEHAVRQMNKQIAILESEKKSHTERIVNAEKTLTAAARFGFLPYLQYRSHIQSSWPLAYIIISDGSWVIPCS